MGNVDGVLFGIYDLRGETRSKYQPIKPNKNINYRKNGIIPPSSSAIKNTV